MMFRILLLLLVPVLYACAAANGSGDDRFARVEISPDKIPEQASLVQEQAILVVQVIATASEYKLNSHYAYGVPTQHIDQQRDVLLVARDSAGRKVASVSVFNPREIHTAGTDKPAKDILDTGSFTIAFPEPSQIKSIEVEVRRGPNEKLHQTFAIKSQKK